MDQILPQEYREHRRHQKDLMDLIPSIENTEQATRTLHRTTVPSLAWQAGMGEKAWACPDRCMWVGAWRVWRHRWAHAGYNHEHKQKETLTYWHRQAGVGTDRQVGIGKSGHGVRKHGHAQTGTCRWVQEGCGSMGGCMQVTIVNTSRKKRKEKLTYWHRWAGTGTGM